MFLLIAVLAIASAAFLFIRYGRKHANTVPASRNSSIEPPANARPLFMPSDDELRREELAKEAAEIAKREVRFKTEAREAIDTALAAWRDRHDRSSAAELLRVTARHGELPRAATEVLEFHRSSPIGGLSDGELAALIDSHISLIPTNERETGALFRLRQEVAELRSRNRSES